MAAMEKGASGKQQVCVEGGGDPDANKKGLWEPLVLGYSLSLYASQIFSACFSFRLTMLYLFDSSFFLHQKDKQKVRERRKISQFG